MCAGIIGRLGKIAIASTYQNMVNVTAKIKKQVANRQSHADTQQKNHHIWKEHYPDIAEFCENNENCPHDIALLFKEGTTTHQTHLTNDTFLIEVTNGDKKTFLTLDEKTKQFITTEQWKEGQENKISLQCDGELYDILLPSDTKDINLDTISRQTKIVSQNPKDLKTISPEIIHETFDDALPTFHDDIDELDRLTGKNSLMLLPDTLEQTQNSSSHPETTDIPHTLTAYSNASHKNILIKPLLGLVGLGSLPTTSALNAGLLVPAITIGLPAIAMTSLIGFGITKAYKHYYQTPLIDSVSSTSKEITDWSKKYPHLIPSDINHVPSEIRLLFEKDTHIKTINITDTLTLIEIKNDNIATTDNTEKKSFIILNTQKGQLKTDYIFTTHKDTNGITYPMDGTPNRKNNPTDKDENREIFPILIGDKKYNINCPQNSFLEIKANYIRTALEKDATTSSGTFENFTITDNFFSTQTKEIYDNFIQKRNRIKINNILKKTTPPSLNNIVLEKQDDAHYLLKMSDDESNHINIALDHKNSDIEGHYTKINFTINQKPCAIRLYEKQFTEDKLREAIGFALKEIQEKTNIPYDFKYRDDKHYPYPKHYPLTSDDSAPKLVKDHDGYYIYSAQNDILSSEYAFNPVKKDSAPARKTLQTPHILHFRIKDKIHTLTLYKNTVSDTDIQHSIQKALELNNNHLVLDNHLNLLQNSQQWKEKYPSLKPNIIKTFPKDIQSLFDEDALIYKKTLNTNKDLLEIHTADKKYFILSEHHYNHTDFDKITVIPYDNHRTLETIENNLSSLSDETSPALFIPTAKTKTAKDWQETYPQADIKTLSPEIALLFDSATHTKEVFMGDKTTMIELNHKGQKSFLTCQKNTPAHIFTPVISEELDLGGNKKTTLRFGYNGKTYHNSTLPDAVKNIHSIDIENPSIKDIFAPKKNIPETLPSVTLYPPLEKRYQLLKSNTDYHIHNNDDNTQTTVTVLGHQKDVHGHYTQIHFEIDTKEYTQKLYSKTPPTEDDIHNIFEKALKHLEKNPTTTSYMLDDERNPTYPPVISQKFDSVLGTMHLVKDGDIYNLFSEDGKICLTKDDFKIENSNDPFATHGLDTYHSLNFTIKNKPYKVDLYKNIINEYDVTEAIKKAIESKGNVILDKDFNHFKTGQYWKDTYPILSKTSVPPEIKRLIDKDTLSRTAELTPTTRLIEMNYKGEKSFLTSQKIASGENKFTVVEAWGKDDGTKMLCFEIDTQKYDAPLPTASLQEINITLPNDIKELFKPTDNISTQELLSTHPTVKQKSSETYSAHFTPSFSSSRTYRKTSPNKKTKLKRFLEKPARKTYSLASSMTSGLSGFFGNMFGGFLTILGNIAPYLPNSQGNFMASPQHHSVPNYFMPPQNNLHPHLPMPEAYSPHDNIINTLLQNTPSWMPPKNLSPDIEIYKPPYAQHTPVHSSLPQKMGKFPKTRQSGYKAPKAEQPFFKPDKYHPYKKDPSQKEYDPFKYQQDPQFYQNFQPAYQNTAKPYYPISPQDAAYMEQFLDDSNKP